MLLALVNSRSSTISFFAFAVHFVQLAAALSCSSVCIQIRADFYPELAGMAPATGLPAAPMRILFLSLEFSAGTFSGNGVYAQSQVTLRVFSLNLKRLRCCILQPVVP